MAKTKVKPSLTERKARFEKAKLDFETGIIEKVATAFYASAMTELMQIHRWKPVQCKLFLDAVTERARGAILLTAAHREAVNHDILLSETSKESVNGDASRS